MNAISTLLRLGFAACLSGAAAGLLLTGTLFLGSHVGEPLLGWTGAGSGRLADLWSVALFGTTLGIVVAALPAFFAGAAMWSMGRHNRTARGTFAWAAAGAAVGALLWTLLELSFPDPGQEFRLTWSDAGLLLACLASGAGGALAFRAAMKWTRFMEE